MCVCVCVCARACVRMYSSNFTIHQFLKCPGNPTKCLTGFKISYNKYVFTISKTVLEIIFDDFKNYKSLDYKAIEKEHIFQA